MGFYVFTPGLRFELKERTDLNSLIHNLFRSTLGSTYLKDIKYLVDKHSHLTAKYS